MYVRVLIFNVLCLLAFGVNAADRAELALLEKTYRELIVAIHNKDLDKIMSFVHPDGLGGADTSTPKEDVDKDLHDPGSYLSTALFDNSLEMANELCDDQGRAPLSPYAFYEKFGDKYKVTTQVLKEGEYYSVGSTAKSSDKNPCQYFLFGLTFAKTKEGKFLLISNFR